MTTKPPEVPPPPLVAPDGTELTDAQAAALAVLREPFPEESIGQLVRIACKACKDSQRRRCERHNWVQRCDTCGGAHTEAVAHIPYVGHAAVTDRLLAADPCWWWEPCNGFTGGMAPVIEERDRRVVEMWIVLHVAGMHRYGVGTAPINHEDRAKILIGDAIRNAAMRFGCALKEWSKTPLESQVAADEVAPLADPEGDEPAPPAPKQATGRQVRDMSDTGEERTVDAATGEVSQLPLGELSPMQLLNQLPSRQMAKVARKLRDAGMPWPLPSDWDEIDDPDLLRSLVEEAA